MAEKKIAVIDKDPSDLPLLVVDRTKFEKLFALPFQDELVSLSEGRALEIQAHSIQDPHSQNPLIQIDIQGDGPCLSNETIDSLFDPFFNRRADPQAFGIHLVACYFIVYYHGGTLTARNRRSVAGTHFTLTFPMQARHRTPIETERTFLSKLLGQISRIKEA